MNRFTDAARNALNSAAEISANLGHTWIGSEHILYGLIDVSGSVASKILTDSGLTASGIESKIKEKFGTGEPMTDSPSEMTPRTKNILENSLAYARRSGQSYIGTEHLLLALLAEDDSVAAVIIKSFGAHPEKIRERLISYINSTSETETFTKDEFKGKKRESRPDASTPALNQFGRDLTLAASEGKLDPVIGRDTELARVIQILSRRSKNNPCLIGEPGVGKTAIAEGLSERIVAGDVPETLAGARVVALDLSGMVAGSKYRGEFEEKLKNAINEVIKNKKIILFIDEIHNLVGAGSAEGAIDAANILKPALSRGEIKVIGATTLNEYRKYIEKDSALERRFQPVTVGEPTEEETLEIMKGLRDKYEAHHKIKISDDALEAAIKFSVRYIGDRFLPDKALDLVDEAASKVRIDSFTTPDSLKAEMEDIKKCAADKEEAARGQNFELAGKLRDKEREMREKYEADKKLWEEKRASSKAELTEEDIAAVVTQWTGIPVSRLVEAESEKLLHLEDTIKERVIGQDEAVSAVARAIKRGRVGLKDKRRPSGSFIFLGPTGVGKTELAKALAAAVFGDENKMIRVDMSEFMEKHSVSKLIGSPPGYVGYDDGGQLTEKVRRNPYSVILFDEIEKAHPDVFNILLQVLEDGVLTDAHGKKTDFKNTVIILTSNVGAKALTENKNLGFSSGESKTDAEKKAKENVMNALKSTFRPEFLNRIDDIIVFSKLSEEVIKKIAEKMLCEVGERLKGMGIGFSYSEDVVGKIASEGFDEVYGARPLRRAVQRLIEDPLAEEILEGKFAAGSTVKASAEQGKIVFT